MGEGCRRGGGSGLQDWRAATLTMAAAAEQQATSCLIFLKLLYHLRKDLFIVTPPDITLFRVPSSRINIPLSWRVLAPCVRYPVPLPRSSHDRSMGSEATSGGDG
eukprot:1371946-Amorphochlora_amoeboformis.AAC.1